MKKQILLLSMLFATCIQASGFLNLGQVNKEYVNVNEILRQLSAVAQRDGIMFSVRPDGQPSFNPEDHFQILHQLECIINTLKSNINADRLRQGQLYFQPKSQPSMELRLNQSQFIPPANTPRPDPYICSLHQDGYRMHCDFCRDLQAKRRKETGAYQPFVAAGCSLPFSLPKNA